MASISTSTTARSTATSSACARSSSMWTPSSATSRRSTASATATASAPHEERADPSAGGMNTDVHAAPIPPERAQAPAPAVLPMTAESGPAPAAAESSRPARRRRFSPLTLKILAVNVLALVVLAAGFFFVDDYRRSLIESKLQAMTIEARLIATALGAAATVTVETDGSPEDQLARDTAPQVLRRLMEQPHERARLFEPAGEMIADSRVLGGAGGSVEVEPLAPFGTGPTWVEERAIEAYEWIVSWLPRERLTPFIELPIILVTDYVETEAALTGDTMTMVRDADTTGRTQILSVAVPVQKYRAVVGVLQLLVDSSEIDQSIRQVRFSILRAFAGALLITVLLS